MSKAEAFVLVNKRGAVVVNGIGEIVSTLDPVAHDGLLRAFDECDSGSPGPHRWAHLTEQTPTFPAETLLDGFAAPDAPEEFVRALLWDMFPECCGCPVVGAEYMGSQEMVCCGNPQPDLLNDKQIVASLRERFPEIKKGGHV